MMESSRFLMLDDLRPSQEFSMVAAARARE
jgi:hypothetical protein